MALSSLEGLVIFHPARGLSLSPEDLRLPHEEVTLETSDAERLGAWLLTARGPAATVLFLHGNAGNRSHRLTTLAAFPPAGLAVLVLDYRGYGDSTGSPSEEGILRDARAGWDHLAVTRGIPAERIVLYGESLGSVAAIGLARSLKDEGLPGPGAVVLEGAFTSALEMGRRHFPFLPVRWLLRSRLDNLAAIREMESPTLFLHAEEDEVSPIDMARRLHAASPARLKEFVEFPGATHNTLWVSAAPRVLETVRRFVDVAVPAAGR